QGPQGLQGPQGAQGSAGATGAQGAKGLNFKGEWNTSISYITDDSVSYNGSSWIAKQANSGSTPAEDADWTIVALKGDSGATGATGPQGSKGDTGANGATGSQGLQGNTGANGA